MDAAISALKIGVVGTGGRGTGACANALVADPAVELVAMADIGQDRIDASLARLRGHRDLQEMVGADMGIDNQYGPET